MRNNRPYTSPLSCPPTQHRPQSRFADAFVVHSTWLAYHCLRSGAESVRSANTASAMLSVSPRDSCLCHQPSTISMLLSMDSSLAHCYPRATFRQQMASLHSNRCKMWRFVGRLAWRGSIPSFELLNGNTSLPNTTRQLSMQSERQ